MGNILLRVFRESHKYTSRKIAASMGISPKRYEEIENGELLMNYEHAEKLGKLYNIKTDLIYSSALQLDALLTRKEIIKILKYQNEQLGEQLKQSISTLSAKNPGKGKVKKNPLR